MAKISDFYEFGPKNFIDRYYINDFITGLYVPGNILD